MSSVGSGCPWDVPAGHFSFRVRQGGLEPQILSQEHGEDAAQVVHRGGVQVGLRVARRVPDRGEGHGDEVEYWDPCRREGRLGQADGRPRSPDPGPGKVVSPPPRRY